MSEYFLRFDPQEIKAENTIYFLDCLHKGKLLSLEEFNAVVPYMDGEYSYEEYLKIFEDFRKD